MRASLSSISQKFGEVITVIAMSLFSFLVTLNPLLSAFRFQVVYVSLFALLIGTFIIDKSHRMRQYSRLVVFGTGLFILLLVGSTGWFDSPFTFGIFFLIILYTFFFSAIVAITQTGMLLVFVFMTLSSADPTRYFLTILSLVVLIPISFYLKDTYVSFNEREKSIIFLGKKHKKYESSVEELLDNAITRYASLQRENLNQLKQLIHRHDSVHDSERQVILANQMKREIEKSLKQVDDFEEETTGKKLIHSSRS